MNAYIINNVVAIMNNSIRGWEKKGWHRFTGSYGNQKCYVRIKPSDGFVSCEDMELPFD